MRFHPWLCLAALLGAHGAWMSAFAAEHDTTTCPAIVVDQGAGSAEDRALVCDGAAKARVFFRSHGIGVERQIRIRLHAAGIVERANHIGLYDAEKDQVELLTFERAKRQTLKDSLFGMQMNEALYVGVVVHEIAHAIAGQHFEIRPASVVAQEYIAYAAQLSTMAPCTRSKILQRYDLAAFDDIEEMSSTFYGLNPSGFGIKVFRHYQSLSGPERGQFIRDLLSGAVRPIDSESEWW